MRGANKVTHIYFVKGNSYKVIGNGAFSKCSSLIQATLPNTIETIGDEAFLECFSLTTVNLPDTLKEIGARAFSGSTAQTMRVAINELPSGLNRLGQGAFSNGGPNIIITHLPKNITTLNG
jgi:hypothetical protein